MNLDTLLIWIVLALAVIGLATVGVFRAVDFNRKKKLKMKINRTLVGAIFMIPLFVAPCWIAIYWAIDAQSWAPIIAVGIFFSTFIGLCLLKE